MLTKNQAAPQEEPVGVGYCAEGQGLRNWTPKEIYFGVFNLKTRGKADIQDQICVLQY